MRELTRTDVDIHVEAAPDSVELVLQWFDDKKIAQGILERLKTGDAWAWGSVTMQLSYRGFMSRPTTTPGCSFSNEDEFRKSSYFEEMLRSCLKDLNTTFQEASPATKSLIRERLAHRR